MIKPLNETVIAYAGIPLNYGVLRRKGWDYQPHGWEGFTQQNEFHAATYARVLTYVTAALEASSRDPGSVVDLGAGPGTLLGLIRDARPFSRLVGIDYCPGMINLAEGQESLQLSPIDYYPADLERALASQLPEKELRSFDVASSIFLLDEVENLDAAFKAAAQLVRSGGVYIAATLDPKRERERYAKQIAVCRAPANGVVTLHKTFQDPDTRAQVEMYRIIRPERLLVQNAEKAGFVCESDESIPPGALGVDKARPTLRLQKFRRK